jgi:beta-N-acetylhexosaminidase
MSALQNQAVLACGKHFPGHGDADADSHYALPVLRQSLDALRARELQPFVAAIQANIPMLMTGHMFLPAVDGVEPVTLSKRFTHDLLRRELGFTGVVTTDDLGMKAVSGIFDDPTAAARVIASGTDLLMVCPHWTNTDRCRGFAAAILDAARTGTLSERVLEQSKERIHALLSRSKTHDVTRLPDEVFKQNQTSGELFVEETVEIT